MHLLQKCNGEDDGNVYLLFKASPLLLESVVLRKNTYNCSSIVPNKYSKQVSMRAIFRKKER